MKKLILDIHPKKKKKMLYLDRQQQERKVRTTSNINKHYRLVYCGVMVQVQKCKSKQACLCSHKSKLLWQKLPAFVGKPEDNHISKFVFCSQRGLIDLVLKILFLSNFKLQYVILCICDLSTKMGDHECIKTIQNIKVNNGCLVLHLSRYPFSASSSYYQSINFHCLCCKLLLLLLYSTVLLFKIYNS